MLRETGPIDLQIKLGLSLRLHAIVAINENKLQAAVDDVQLILKIADGARRDPTLLGGLISIALTKFASDVIDRGLQSHAWNDAQLVGLQTELSDLDFLSQYQATMRGEIITETIPNFEFFKRTSGRSSPFKLFPAGWLDQDKSEMVDFLFRQLKSVDPKIATRLSRREPSPRDGRGSGSASEDSSVEIFFCDFGTGIFAYGAAVLFGFRHAWTRIASPAAWSDTDSYMARIPNHSTH